jgi:hypothetical protein
LGIAGIRGVIGQDRVRQHRGGCEAEVVIDEDFNAVGGEDFERGGEGGLGESVSILRKKEWAGGALLRAVLDDSLGNGEDVRVVEAGVERRSAMARGAEADTLRKDLRIGVVGVKGGDEARQIDELVGRGEMAGSVQEWIWSSGTHAGRIIQEQ